MSKEKELIAEQALENKALKEQNEDYKDRLDEIYSKLVCVGGPLNDNFDQYNKKQLKIFFQIKIQAEV